MELPQAFQPYASHLKVNEPLSAFTYMKVGGPADYAAVVTDKTTLIGLIQAAKAERIRYIVLGGGSNTIFSDAGYRGLVIINRTSGLAIDTVNSKLLVDAGVATNAIVNQANSHGLAGLETFLGIPGSIGGAIYNNSHYLKELIGDHVSRVELLAADGTVYWETKQGMQFAYDYSKLHETHETILSVEFLLQKGNPQTLTETARQALKRRHDTQPLSLPSSGCMFQNVKTTPQPTSAGALIDKAGLKGFAIGGAEISTVHANFIVNKGTATTQDIIDLSNHIISVIKDAYGLTLQREVFILDEYGERMQV